MALPNAPPGSPPTNNNLTEYEGEFDDPSPPWPMIARGRTAPDVVDAVAREGIKAEEWKCDCPIITIYRDWLMSYPRTMGRQCTTRTDLSGGIVCPIRTAELQGCDRGCEKHLKYEHDWVKQA